MYRQLTYLILFILGVVIARSNNNFKLIFLGDFLANYSIWRIFNISPIRSGLVAFIMAVPQGEIFGHFPF